MKIGFAIIDGTNDIEKNLMTIENTLSNSNSDILLFGEASLHGFDALSFDYTKDIKIAIAKNSIEIAKLKNLCKKLNRAIGFGYYENFKGALYSSYMIIDNFGKEIANYQRISPGWKEPFANAEYREGTQFTSFHFKGKKFGLAICGDLWEDDYLMGFVEMDSDVDMIVWPVYCDFSKEEWRSHYKAEYKKRMEIFEKPVAFINNYMAKENKAKGGAYIFKHGKIIESYPMGTPGILEVEM